MVQVQEEAQVGEAVFIHWKDFRLLRPLAGLSTKTIGDMFIDRTIAFDFEDDPALYVRLMHEKRAEKDKFIDLGYPSPGVMCYIIWTGFEEEFSRRSA